MTNMYHPAIENQFYRLDRDSPTSPWVKTTRWNHTHADSAGHVINWDSKLCMATVGAVVLDAQSGGLKRTSPGGVHDHQFDMSGGIGVDDVDLSLNRGWNEDLYIPDGFDRSDTLYAIKHRRATLIGVDYGVVPSDYQSQKGGDFPHALVLEDWRASDSRIKVYDSLATNPRWWPQSAVWPAAEALAMQERGTKGRLFVAFTKIRPLLDANATVRVSIQPKKGYHGYPNTRDFGIYTVVNGIITKRVGTTTGGFSANADHRDVYRWPGHSSQELVHITSGFLAGHNAWVLAKYVEG